MLFLKQSYFQNKVIFRTKLFLKKSYFQNKVIFKTKLFLEQSYFQNGSYQHFTETGLTQVALGKRKQFKPKKPKQVTVTQCKIKSEAIFYQTEFLNKPI